MFKRTFRFIYVWHRHLGYKQNGSVLRNLIDGNYEEGEEEVQCGSGAGRSEVIERRSA